MADLIQQLDIYRLEHRLSQRRLAAQIGVAFVTVSRWLNGHQKPNKIQEYHIRKLLKRHNRK